MRVLFLTHSYPRYVGDAAGAFLLALAQALKEEGVDVHVVAPMALGLAASESLGGVAVTRFRYAPRKYETLAYSGTMTEEVTSRWSAKGAMLSFLCAEFTAAVRKVRIFRPDVIHAHWWFPSGLVGAWASAFTQTPLVTTVHGTDLRMLRGTSVFKPLARHVLEQSVTVTAVSNWLAREGGQLMRERAPVVAPMPAATKLFTPGGERDARQLLFVGRLTAQKGVEYAIRAVAAMRTPAKLDVVGSGPRLDACRILAQGLGVAKRVCFHGHVTQPELPPFYRRAAAVIVPSTDEGLGLVTVEAQLCETPVVAFGSGGIIDVVQHGRTGILVPPGDVSALAAALDELLSEPTTRVNLGRAGRQYALATFAPESVARQYKGIYRETLKRRAA